MNIHPGPGPGPGAGPPSQQHPHPHYPPPPPPPHNHHYADPTQGYPPPHYPGMSHQHPDELMHDPDHEHDDSDGGIQAGPPGEGGLDGAPKRKRRRQALSCTECKRRKIKCDRQNPCGPCVRRNENDKCKWHVIEPIEKFVTRTEYDDLKRKFDMLEQTVAQLTGRPLGYPGPPGWVMPPMGEPSSPRSPSMVVDPNLSSEAAESKKREAQTQHHLHLDHSGGGDTLERLRQHQQPQPQLPFPTMVGNPMPIPRMLPILPNLHPDNWAQLGGSASPGLMLGLAAFSSGGPQLNSNTNTKNKKSASASASAPLNLTPTTLPTTYWIQGLPPKSVCDSIIKYYFDCVCWNHGIVIESDFGASMESFWRGEGEVSTAWVSLLFMLLYHGVSNMDPEDEKNEATVPNVAEWRRLCQAFWHGAQFAMSQVDLAATKEMEIVQALTLLAFVYLSLDTKGWQAFGPTLAFTIRVTQNMGFNHLGKEEEGVIPPPGIRTRELQRHIWWTLVTFDWQYASHLGYTYSIHPSQFDTAMPTNVNLEDLRDNRVFQGNSDDVPTTSSLLRAKCFIAEKTRSLCDSKTTEGELAFDALVRYDKDLANTYATLPSWLIQKDEKIEKRHHTVIRLMFTIGISSSIIGLHRTHFLKNYKDPSYAHAVAASVSAADKVLGALKEIEFAHLPARRWWGVLLHCYKACVVLLLDHRQRGGELASGRVGRIEAVMALLRSAQEVIFPARKASLVLQHLLDDVSERSKKRAPEGGEASTSLTSKARTSKKASPAAPADAAIWENILDLELEVEVMEVGK